jgi:Mn2+/Fe2+ NRAMP family transporter
VARYGLAFVFLLIPACLIQWPVNYAIGRYTILTGESILRGFLRLSRGFGIALWVLLALSFVWVGAFASAGGTALAAIVDWPAGWSDRARTLLWAYAAMALLLGAFLLSRRFYRFIEWFMTVTSLATLRGSCSPAPTPPCSRPCRRSSRAGCVPRGLRPVRGTRGTRRVS